MKRSSKRRLTILLAAVLFAGNAMPAAVYAHNQVERTAGQTIMIAGEKEEAQAAGGEKTETKAAAKASKAASGADEKGRTQNETFEAGEVKSGADRSSEADGNSEGRTESGNIKEQTGSGGAPGSSASGKDQAQTETAGTSETKETGASGEKKETKAKTEENQDKTSENKDEKGEEDSLKNGTDENKKDKTETGTEEGTGKRNETGKESEKEEGDGKKDEADEENKKEESSGTKSEAGKENGKDELDGKTAETGKGNEKREGTEEKDGTGTETASGEDDGKSEPKQKSEDEKAYSVVWESIPEDAAEVSVAFDDASGKLVFYVTLNKEKGYSFEKMTVTVNDKKVNPAQRGKNEYKYVVKLDAEAFRNAEEFRILVDCGPEPLENETVDGIVEVDETTEKDGVTALVFDNKKGTELIGIREEWLKKLKTADGKKLQIRVKIPNGTEKIGKDAFSKYNWRSAWGCAQENSDYILVGADFTEAEQLTEIGEQAFSDTKNLTGTIDLSNTQVTEIKNNAFAGSAIEEVILPNTLKVLGERGKDDGTGPFCEARSLISIRCADSSADTAFELPESLEWIGKQTFLRSFAPKVLTNAKVPGSVTHIGAEAFTTGGIRDIYLMNEDAGETDYHAEAFKYGKYGKGERIIVFPNKETFSAYHAKTYFKTACAYAVDVHFKNTDETEASETQKKLANQSVRYVQNSDGTFTYEKDYKLPEGSWNIEKDKRRPVNDETVLTSSVWQDMGKKDTLTLYKDPAPIKVNYPKVYVTVDGIRQKQPEVSIDRKDGIQYELYLPDDGAEHHIGVELGHELLKKDPKQTKYVEFEYGWIDIITENVASGVGMKPGPRSRRPDPGFDVYSPKHNEISIDLKKGRADLRYDGNPDWYRENMYRLLINGYYTDTEEGIYRHPVYTNSSGTIGIGSGEEVRHSYTYDFHVSLRDVIWLGTEDLTAYAGGKGYEGLVAENGKKGAKDSGAPEPVYWIEAKKTDLNPDKIETLSFLNGNKKFKAKNFRGFCRLTGGETPRVQYEKLDRDGKGTGVFLQKDAFLIGEAGGTCEQYKMRLYDGEATADGTLFKNLKAKDENGGIYSVQSKERQGILTVCALENPGEETFVKVETAVTSAPPAGKAKAAAKEGTEYMVTMSVPAGAKDGISLLFDDILNSDGKGAQRRAGLETAADRRLAELGVQKKNRQYEMKYLDLVDHNDGNIRVSPSEDIDVYWGYPQGTDKTTKFYLLKSTELRRDNIKEIPEGAGFAPEHAEESILLSEKTENTEYGIKFAMTSLACGPYILTWEKEEKPNPKPEPKPETVTVSGRKTWEDENNKAGKRPASVTINLLSDGVKTDSRTVTEADGWKWDFAELPKQKDGKDVAYTISEDAVEGYETTINGYNVINRYKGNGGNQGGGKPGGGSSGSRPGGGSGSGSGSGIRHRSENTAGYTASTDGNWVHVADRNTTDKITWNVPEDHTPLTHPEQHLWKFVLKDGSTLRSQWAYIRNPYVAEGQPREAWFLFDKDGVMRYGWHKHADKDGIGKWYYLHGDSDGMLGSMHTGFYRDEQDGRTYYLNPENGEMLTGWQQIGGKYYYFNPVTPKETWRYDESLGVWLFDGERSGQAVRPYGSMYRNEMTPDGRFVDESGVRKD